MNSMAVSELRANLMKVLKRIKNGDVINITSRGRVVAKLVPPEYTRDKAKERLKELSKSAVIGDLISPVDSKWKALE